MTGVLENIDCHRSKDIIPFFPLLTKRSVESGDYSYFNFGANSIVHSQIRTCSKDEFVQNNLFLRYNLQRAFPQMLFWGKKHECFKNTITKICDEEI